MVSWTFIASWYSLVLAKGCEFKSQLLQAVTVGLVSKALGLLTVQWDLKRKKKDQIEVSPDKGVCQLPYM